MHSSTGIKRFAGVFVAGLLAALASGALSESAVTQGSKAADRESCVEPTADIRRNHMDYLKHERVGTVHEGIRGRKHSLAGCVDCHSAKDDAGGYKPVDAEGEFCDSCHDYVAVDLTCFQCHRKTPDDKASAARALAGKGEPGMGHALGLRSATGRVPVPGAEGSDGRRAIILEDGS